MKVEIDWGGGGEVDCLKRAALLWGYAGVQQSEKSISSLVDQTIEDLETQLKVKICDLEHDKVFSWVRLYSKVKYMEHCQCDFILDSKDEANVSWFSFAKKLRYRALVGLEPWRVQQLVKLITAKQQKPTGTQ